jgi:hypothetical protein
MMREVLCFIHTCTRGAEKIRIKWLTNADFMVEPDSNTWHKSTIMCKASWGLSHWETQDNPTIIRIVIDDIKEGFLAKAWNVFHLLGVLHTMAEGWEAVDFHQSNCKQPRGRPLDPSHYIWPKSKDRCNLDWLLFEEGDGLSRKFGLDGNGNPNYGRKAVGFFS